jgi:LysM repeat protein
MQSSAPYRPTPSNSQQTAEASDSSEQCPFLGSSTAPGTSLEFSSDSNKCFSTRLAVPVSTIHQANYCLSSNYETCPVYRERAGKANGAPVVPLAAIATAAATATAVGATGAAVGATNTAAGSSLSWSEPLDIFAPAGQESSSSVAEATPPQPSAVNSPLLFPWEETPHPDFQADLVSATARRRSRQVNRRPVLIALLLLALIPLAWWAWTSVRPGSRGADETVEGTVVTLPTLMATTRAGAPAAGGGDIASNETPATTESGGSAGSAGALPGEATAEPTAEPTASELENIALTATALFVNATAVTECAAPSWWVAYTVEEGDTIDALAVTRGISSEELIVANCLAGPDLVTGSMLLLPPVGVIALLPTATATATPPATRVTRVPTLPTRRPIFFPTPTFPVVIILTPAAPTAEPTDEPATRPPARPTTAPTSAAQPTATAPNPLASATSTPPAFMTSTPPPIGGTATPTPTGTAGVATQTPPPSP